MLINSYRFLFETTDDAIQSTGLMLLRIGVSIFMILLHGWPKFSNYSEAKFTFFDPFGLGSEFSLALAIFAEIICSVLLVTGLFTRIAVILLAITMIVAAFLFNAGQELIVREKGILYLMIYLFLLLVGPGKYSADVFLFDRQKNVNMNP